VNTSVPDILRPRYCPDILCRQAGGPRVCVHGLRGTWSTMAIDAGTASHVVARELGHSNSVTTLHQHYDEPGSVDRRQAKQALKVIHGGGVSSYRFSSPLYGAERDRTVGL